MDYQSNSKKNKEDKIKPEKQIEKVVTGEVVQKEKSPGRKFKEIFFGGTVKDSSRRVLGEVLLPALRNMVFEAIDKGSSGFAAGLIFGDPHRRRTPSSDYRPRISYHDPFSPRDPRERPRLPDQNPYRRERRESKDYIVATKEEADEVVEKMYDCINQYDVVSLADLHEMLGFPTSPIENKWGWSYLSNVQIRQQRNGWLIDLPAVEAI